VRRSEDQKIRRSEDQKIRRSRKGAKAQMEEPGGLVCGLFGKEKNRGRKVRRRGRLLTIMGFSTMDVNDLRGCINGIDNSIFVG
jgi:hypothetical protein